MAPKVTLPPPPTDLPTRKLPLVTVKGSLYRIHRTVQHWRYFGKNASERFDDPLKRYGVLYVSSRPEAAFAEVFLRTLSLMVVDEVDLRARSLTSFAANSLRCLDLAGSGLRKLSCHNRISTEKPYTTVGLWSRALYSHPQQPDGIIYRSRHNPRFRCLALFDRCAAKLSAGSSEELMGVTRRAWTSDQLVRYDLSLA
jgi:RES domain